MTVNYARLTRNCETQNQFNSVHIELEREITPLELGEIAAAAQAGRLPGEAKVWTDRWLDYMPTLGTAPEPYLAQRVSSSLTWLRPRRARGAKPRVLIAFCGAKDRLALPLPVFLQLLPAAQWNILKVSRPSHLTDGSQGAAIKAMAAATQAMVSGTRYRGYMRAGSELGDLNRVFSAIRTALETVAPGDVTVFGSSSGGAAALLAALRLGAPRCLVVGGRLPDNLVPLLPALTAPNPPARTAFTFMFAANNKADRANSDALLRQFGGTRVAIAGVAQHNVLAKLAERNELLPVLTALLDGRALSPGMVDDAL